MILEDLPGDACLHCGIELPAGTMAAYCSRRCRDGYRSAMLSAALAEAWAGLTCIWCGKPLTGTRADQKYCGARCLAANRRARTSVARAAARAGRTCPECGGAVAAKRSDKVYCSPACGKRRYGRLARRFPKGGQDGG